MLSRVARFWFSGSRNLTFCTLQRLEGNHQGIALIQLNNPEKRNALSKQLLEDLKYVIEETRNDQSIRVAILRSKTPGMFCAGADLKERLGYSIEQTEQTVINLRNTFDEFYQLPFPTIACIDGPALGGGLELALNADLRIATRSSLIGLPETALAIIPGAGGTQKLARLIGISKAKELIFTAKRLKAEEALAYGIVNYVEDDYDKCYAKALELSEQINNNGPLGVRSAKAAINNGIEVDLRRGLEIEKLNYLRVLYSNDRIEGLKAFSEKRKPKYNGN